MAVTAPAGGFVVAEWSDDAADEGWSAEESMRRKVTAFNRYLAAKHGVRRHGDAP